MSAAKSTSGIAAALLEAQRAVPAVGKDATARVRTKSGGEYSYNYASVESMMEACRHALQEAGLSLSLTTYSYNDDCSLVFPEFLLEHPASGESRTYLRPWPVIPGPGQPLDKATGGALSSCWTYALRDLLQVPRPDENEMNGRGLDPDHKPTARGNSKVGKQILEEINDALKIAEGDLPALMATVKTLKDDGKFQRLRKFAGGSVADETEKRINAMIVQLRKTARQSQAPSDDPLPKPYEPLAARFARKLPGDTVSQINRKRLLVAASDLETVYTQSLPGTEQEVIEEFRGSINSQFPEITDDNFGELLNLIDARMQDMGQTSKAG